MYFKAVWGFTKVRMTLMKFQNLTMFYCSYKISICCLIQMDSTLIFAQKYCVSQITS